MTLPIKIGLIGAQRTGKTTLAKVLSEKLMSKRIRTPYLDAKVLDSTVWNAGYKPDERVTFLERLTIQETILNEYSDTIASAKSNGFVVDRTPLDILSYLLISLDDTATSLVDARVTKFRNTALSLCKQFTHFVIVQPGISYSKVAGKSGKVFSTRVFQETFSDLSLGILFRGIEVIGKDTKIIILDKDITDLEKRVDAVYEQILNSLS